MEAVPYGSPSLDQSALDYTLIAVGAALGLPILFGIVYARISVYRTRSLLSTTDKSASTEVISASTSGKRAGMASYLTRMSDMRSNPVLRLWWNRQGKLYSTTENDAESHALRDDQGGIVAGASRNSEARELRKVKTHDESGKKLKKDKKLKSEVISNEADKGEAISRLKKEKKEKKSKKSEKVHEVENIV